MLAARFVSTQYVYCIHYTSDIIHQNRHSLELKYRTKVNKVFIRVPVFDYLKKVNSSLHTKSRKIG